MTKHYSRVKINNFLGSENDRKPLQKKGKASLQAFKRSKMADLKSPGCKKKD